MGHNCCFVYCVISANEADKAGFMFISCFLDLWMKPILSFPPLPNPADRTATATEPNIRINQSESSEARKAHNETSQLGYC